MGAATCTAPASTVIRTVFRRLLLRRTSYSMVVSPKRILRRFFTAHSSLGSNSAMREPVAPVDAYVILGARCYAAENHWQFL